MYSENVKKRFFEKLLIIPEITCWIWIAGNSNHKTHSYGRFNLNKNKRTAMAHRVAWEIHNNQKIPEGLDVLHSFDVTLCCNPAHLSIGTHKMNMDDAVRKMRFPQQKKTACKNGHLFTGDNVRWVFRYEQDKSKKRRICLTCRKTVGAKSKAKTSYLKKLKLKIVC